MRAGARAAPLIVLAVTALVVPLLGVGLTAPAAAMDHPTTANTVSTAATTTEQPTAANTVSTATPGLNLTFETSLTPATPGEVRTRVRFTVPEGVTSLTARLPADVTVTGADGFRRRAPRRYEWTQTTDRPSITMTVPANVTIQRGRGASATEGVVFADTGEWALIRAPRLAGLTYSGLGDRATIHREQVVNGSGAAGEEILFLGPVEAYSRETGGQRLRLVVPAAADLRESPEAILDALAAANRALTFGARDDRVFVVAAPTDGVSYASTGLQRGDSDIWVRDVQRLDTPENVWVHEYIHTRQDYRGTDRTRWTLEGMADYYAASRTLQRGRINYSQYRRHLSIGARGRYGDVVLANQSTWAGTTANYWKGALVFAGLDRRIRIESDGEATLQDAIRRAQTRSGTALNESTFLGSVEAVAGPESHAFARRYTTTNATPDTWNRTEHARTFGGLADISYRFAGFSVDGPYRNGTLADPVVVPGETLFVRAVATNDGDRAGNYTATLRAGDRTVGSRGGSLAPGESVRLGYRVPFETTGDPAIVVGGARREAGVVDPGTPRVTALRVPDRARVGDPVRLRATVRNPADLPADGRVSLRVDGTVVGERRVQLAPGGETTLMTRTVFERPGEYSVRAGNQSATVRVREPTPAVSPTPTATADAAESATGTAEPTTTTDADGSGRESGTRTVSVTTATDNSVATTTAPPSSTPGTAAAAGADGTPSDVSGPGFGVVLAVVALGLSLGFLRFRRS